MPFLSPNQQCQSTEGNQSTEDYNTKMGIANVLALLPCQPSPFHMTSEQ